MKLVSRIYFCLLLLILPLNNLHSQDSSTVIYRVRKFEKLIGGRIGVMAKNLNTGQEIKYRASEKFPTASVIKLPVMVEYFFQVQAKRISPTQKVELSSANKWGGSGLFQYFLGTSQQKLADAVLMMITISDNTATNMVIDALGESHTEKLAAVNDRMISLGLKNTRLLNKLMSWETKTDSPESIRYGIGVSTPKDMCLLCEKIFKHDVVDSAACDEMIDLMKKQFYNDRIPRFLPKEESKIRVAHKTGSVTGVNNDVGLILSPRVNISLAIFIEQARDRRGGPENETTLVAAKISRLIWNHFTGDTGFERPFATSVDWTSFPGGEWTRVQLAHSPFPHPSRDEGHHYKNRFFPRDPHYCDSSAVIIVPDKFAETKRGTNLIIHFHGWNNDVLNVLEKFNMAQQLLASRKNAILVLAQGPYRALDSAGGKMEEVDGLKNFVDDILRLLTSEKIIHFEKLGKLIITAHSGGYRPAILALERGGLTDKVREVFLFDAFYDLTDKIIPWLKQDRKHHLRSIYTSHLAPEHEEFMKELKKENLSFSEALDKNAQIVLEKTKVKHNEVIENTFLRWLQASQLEDVPK